MNLFFYINYPQIKRISLPSNIKVMVSHLVCLDKKLCFQISNKSEIKRISFILFILIYRKLNAIIHDYPVLFHFQSKDLECRIKLAGEPIKDAGYGLAVKKGDPLRDRISQLIISYQDQGQFAMLKSRWMSTKCEDSLAAGASGGVNQLGVNSFGSLFLVMSAGVIAAIFVLKCEFLYKSFSMKRAIDVPSSRRDSIATTVIRINVKDISDEQTSKSDGGNDDQYDEGFDNVTFEGDGVFYQEKKMTNLASSLTCDVDDGIDDGVVFDEPAELSSPFYGMSSYGIKIPNTILHNEIQRKLKELKPVIFNTEL